jgi:alkyl sulfatase BDS1-like metallo-beta-lactamase superfamily hydrolase
VALPSPSLQVDGGGGLRRQSSPHARDMMSDLPFEDQTDFDNAERGRIDALDPCVVRAADGRVVWDLTAYS